MTPTLPRRCDHAGPRRARRAARGSGGPAAASRATPAPPGPVPLAVRNCAAVYCSWGTCSLVVSLMDYALDPGASPVGAGKSAVVADLTRCGAMLSPRVPLLRCAGSPRCTFAPLKRTLRSSCYATRCAAPTGRPPRGHRRRPELARSDCGRAPTTGPSRVAGHSRQRSHLVDV